ncbi:MAG: O-antigen ligase domain-containing protein, partial [Burkholderiales bacterium]
TSNEESWQRWRNTILASFFTVSILAIVNYIPPDTWPTGGRVGDRNSFSTFVVLIVPFLLLGISQSGIRGMPAMLIWLSVPLALVTGFLTNNRIMWPTFALMTVLFAVLYLYKADLGKRARIVSGAVVLGLLVVFTALFAVVSHQKDGVVEQNIAGVKNSFAEDPRFVIWSYAANRISERPLTGYGYGRGILRKDFREALGSPLRWHAHNMFLNYILEMGPLGGVALIWLFAALAMEFWRLYRSSDGMSWQQGIFGLVVLGGIAIKATTDDILVRDNSLLFWALMGMALGLGHRTSRQAVSRPG